jgi:predicted RecA/RadA family phage recombinase
MEVRLVCSPGVEPESIFAGTVAVKDRRIAEGHAKLKAQADGSAVAFGSRFIVALRHFPSMFEGKHDRPAVFELARLQAENVQADPVWGAYLTAFDSSTEFLSELRPIRIWQGWRVHWP